jgi:hypothetical protein
MTGRTPPARGPTACTVTATVTHLADWRPAVRWPGLPARVHPDTATAATAAAESLASQRTLAPGATPAHQPATAAQRGPVAGREAGQ